MSVLDEWQNWEEPPPTPTPPTPPVLESAGNAIAALAGLVGILAVPMAFASLFSFDAPGSDSNPYLWMFVALTWATPFVMALAAIKGRKAARTASWSTLWLTLVLLLAFAACFAAVLFLNEHFCDGRSVCPNLGSFS